MVSRLAAGRTALFICDMQERFRTPIYSFEHVANMTAKMVKAASILELPVYSTEQNPKALGTTVSELGLDSLPSNLQPLSSPLAKTRFSMVLPEIESSLKKLEVQNVFITGIESHVCVLQTTLDLLERGFGVWVLADAVSSCNAQERPLAFARLKAAGAHISTTESALFELLGDASHPQFKQISLLIKETKEQTKQSVAELLALT